MCSLNDLGCDTFEISQTVEESEIQTINSTAATTCVTDIKLSCKKCDSQEIEASLRGKSGYCRTCLLSTLMHKFKATLGKSKSVRPTDSILITHSGKANSTALVHLMTDSANESASKRLQFKYQMLYVDDGMVKGFSTEERKHIRNALAKEAEQLQITMYITPLTTHTTDILCEEIQSIDALRTNMTHNDESILREMFDGIECETMKDELLRQLKQKVFISAARKLNCNKVFIADTSIDLAIKVLGDISTGRGSQVPLNVGFSDTRYMDVILLRPLRDFTQNDIKGYLECHNIIPIFASGKSNQLFPGCIRNIARNFVHHLDSDFHGTVSTIYRTSEKLATKMKEKNIPNDSKNVKIINDKDTCILCELTLNSCNLQGEQLSVVQARIFSELVSTDEDFPSSMSSNLLNVYNQSKNKQMQEINDLEKKNCHCGNNTCIEFNTSQRELIEAHLCYACKLIVLNSNQKFDLLCSFLYKKIQEKLQITRLREEISEFLL
ncbi:cytosolic thiouridylase subunit 2 [Nomia melanderi]|uniref:cytosolic thiouridylase subunit 2 n=1 Tax=Nomia melanderi TaxID=2448451 RepID=UPI003FCE3AA2